MGKVKKCCYNWFRYKLTEHLTVKATFPVRQTHKSLVRPGFDCTYKYEWEVEKRR